MTHSLSALLGALRLAWRAVTDMRRKRRPLEAVTLVLPSVMPLIAPPLGWLRGLLSSGEPPLSQWAFEQRAQRLAAEPRVTTVVLLLRGFTMPLADLQSLRGTIARLRAKGKRVVALAQNYDLGTYYVASACDVVLLQPGGTMAITGLMQQATFLRDALDAVGVQADVVAISPYKGALDGLTRTEPSEEQRAQIEWLLDGQFDRVVTDLAADRGLSAERMREVIDGAPYLDTFAKGIGLVDDLSNEEDLHRVLGVAHIDPWATAQRALAALMPVRGGKHVVILLLDGLIVPGESRPAPPVPLPLVGSTRTGDVTFVQQVRALIDDKSVGAVVLAVTSDGGSAAASEAMRAALQELAHTRPVVAYFGDVAASGGYWVATATRHIVAQPSTITGSIGVVSAKLLAGGLRERLRVHTTTFTRGANADLFSDERAFTPRQRAWLQESIGRVYELFLHHVARSRNLTTDAVDAVGGGRVWTGDQAQTHGLVDALGGLHDAVIEARRLADLPTDAPLRRVKARRQPLGPKVAAMVIPPVALAYALKDARNLLRGQALALLPFTLKDR